MKLLELIFEIAKIMRSHFALKETPIHLLPFTHFDKHEDSRFCNVCHHANRLGWGTFLETRALERPTKPTICELVLEMLGNFQMASSKLPKHRLNCLRYCRSTSHVQSIKELLQES